jgi:signal transduction histidine kinase/DNA-binding response OmpR family regulator
VPIAQQGQTKPAGVLLVGLNPYRPLSESYTSFVDLVASQIASGLASARAYEAERQRAEALAEMDRAKTAFFSNVSHEFRTPLTLMLGPLEDEIAGRDAATGERLSMVHRNGLRLLRLVNTLLDFSRIEAGRVRATYRPTDLAAYTAELASNFRSACEHAGLALTVDCPPMSHPVYVDADMWERVVLNLVSNAFKYTLDGGVTVTVRLADDRIAELVVCDTGVGIPEDELPRIFDRFHRIEGQAARTMEGTGIGLALVSELVRLHGGTIEVRSKVGVGTAVHVALPLGFAHLPAEQVSHDPGRTMPEGIAAASFVAEAMRWLQQSGRLLDLDAGILGSATALAGVADTGSDGAMRPRVLLADDNADMRDYVMRLLGTQYDVRVVEDGEGALQVIHEQRPDLLLSDVMMPRLDGFGLLAALRADPHLRDLPVILLSARAGEEAHVEGLDAGADDYLVKPFAARELLARVRSNLELARIRREAAEQLRDEARRLELLHRTGNAIAAELNLERLVQTVTDAAVELTGAEFGAFFYNVRNESGESYTLYTLSGAPREAFAVFPMPRNTKVFDPTFRGEGVIRSDDITRDPRYGQNAPYYGKPKGHLPVRSYLAAPVVSRSGEVLGGLFFGHSETSVFTGRDELIIGGIAAQAAIAIDNARLYSASRQAQESLARLNESLEQRVSEEITERMRAEELLRQAQKMEAVGQLTGGVAHDFNNLLTAVCGGADTLRRLLPQELGQHGDRIWRAVRMIEAGSQRAATLTQRLLAFARRQALDPRPLDANKLVAGMSELLRRTLGEAIAIETVLAGGLWRTMADPNHLESALLNLAVNARDAMASGGRLTIETANTYLDETYATQHADVQPGQYVMIAVSDTGTGMTKETMERVFEPFFATKEVGQGTGLGLSQVYGFIKQSDGHIKLYSELEHGTVVKLYLPRLVGEGQFAAEAVAAAEAPNGGSGALVLVVQDDEAVRAYSTEALRELGYRVLAAANGWAGLELLARYPAIRLLFTDVGLPGGMTGRQLADQARQQRRPSGAVHHGIRAQCHCAWRHIGSRHPSAAEAVHLRGVGRENPWVAGRMRTAARRHRQSGCKTIMLRKNRKISAAGMASGSSSLLAQRCCPREFSHSPPPTIPPTPPSKASHSRMLNEDTDPSLTPQTKKNTTVAAANRSMPSRIRNTITTPSAKRPCLVPPRRRSSPPCHGCATPRHSPRLAPRLFRPADRPRSADRSPALRGHRCRSLAATGGSPGPACSGLRAWRVPVRRAAQESDRATAPRQAGRAQHLQEMARQSKPVTSVHAVAPNSCRMSDAVALLVRMEAIAA